MSTARTSGWRYCTQCRSGPLWTKYQAEKHPARVPPYRVYGGRGRCRACYRLAGPPPERYCLDCHNGPLRSKHAHPATPTRLRYGGKGRCGNCYARLARKRRVHGITDTTPVSASALPDEWDGSDFAVVEQAIQGGWTASNMHPEDRRATVAELWRRGWTQVDTAERLSTSKREVERDRQYLRNQARKAGCRR